ncbi:MAG: hypothetical protein WD894_03950 [Pirellulales bacterium]
MATVFDATAFERGIDPLLRFLTPEQTRALIAYRADEALEQRIEELAAKSNEGELTADELAEYKGYVQANKFVAILQARARTLLRAS